MVPQAKIYDMQRDFMKITRLNRTDVAALFEKYPFMAEFELVVQ